MPYDRHPFGHSIFLQSGENAEHFQGDNKVVSPGVSRRSRAIPQLQPEDPPEHQETRGWDSHRHFGVSEPAVPRSIFHGVRSTK